MPDDVLVSKSESIERCLKRISEEYAGNPDHLYKNLTKQDSIVLNLERASQLAIDGAMRIVKIKKLGAPKESREAFVLLEEKGLLTPELSTRIQSMVGFRNLALYSYKDLNLEIIKQIIENHLDDFRAFIKVALTI